MKCKYALKKMYSESISVRMKQEIDEHIAGCSYCQSEIESSENLGELIRVQRLNPPAVQNRSALLHEIRLHREKRQKNWRRRISDLLPLEPAYRRVVFLGAACCVLLCAFLLVSIHVIDEDTMTANNDNDDIEYYLQEHALTKETDLFGQGAFSRTFISLSYSDSKIKYPNYNN